MQHFLSFFYLDFSILFIHEPIISIQGVREVIPGDPLRYELTPLDTHHGECDRGQEVNLKVLCGTIGNILMSSFPTKFSWKGKRQ